ncbi:MAG TPA: condensation domain-containing protein, partial [Pyrinomonadaceae bacterium]|nr:condensation domain-containing protein [Pyrinomonadaceae bacterium]
MVPAAFIFLEQFPLTTSGKVNRRALPAPDASLLATEKTYVKPRTATEVIVSGIWSKVLGVERVGVEDNFFELGGHSLLATQVVSWIEEAFARALPLRTLFEAPTVRELAAHIDRGLLGESTAPALVRVDREQELPVSFAQQRLWFLAQLEPASSFYNLPWALRLHGALDIVALEQTLDELVRRHEVLRTSFVSEHGLPRQVISATATVSLDLVDLSAVAESAVQDLVAREAAQPFDLSRGPLLGVKLIRLSEQEHVLLLTMHHIVSDGWSMGVLIREVSELYSAYTNGREPQLPELPVQYADYAAWQREWLQGEVLEEELRYWREQLAGAPQVLELPTDRVRPAVQSYRGGHEEFAFSKELSDGLKELSRREGVTMFMLLLAAFQVLLSRYSGSEDIVVGTPIAGRRHKEVEGLIGFFVNSLVLRTDVSGNPSFRELLKRVREVCLGAYAHQDVPFEKLVEELQPERALSHTPLFQVMLVLQNTAQPELQLGDLRVEGVGAEGTTAKFDLAFAVQEGSEGLSGVVEYDRSLYDAATIRRQIGHWQVVLEEVVRDADRRVGELELL